MLSVRRKEKNEWKKEGGGRTVMLSILNPRPIALQPQVPQMQAMEEQNRINSKTSTPSSIWGFLEWHHHVLPMSPCIHCEKFPSFYGIIIPSFYEPQCNPRIWKKYVSLGYSVGLRTILLYVSIYLRVYLLKM